MRNDGIEFHHHEQKKEKRCTERVTFLKACCTVIMFQINKKVHTYFWRAIFFFFLYHYVTIEQKGKVLGHESDFSLLCLVLKLVLGKKYMY